MFMYCETIANKIDIFSVKILHVTTRTNNELNRFRKNASRLHVGASFEGCVLN